MDRYCINCHEVYDESFMRGSHCYDCSEEAEAVNPFDEYNEDSYD